MFLIRWSINIRKLRDSQSVSLLGVCLGELPFFLGTFSSSAFNPFPLSFPRCSNYERSELVKCYEHIESFFCP